MKPPMSGIRSNHTVGPMSFWLCALVCGIAGAAIINDDFDAGRIDPARWTTSAGKGQSFVRLEPNEGGRCVHLFGDHSTSELVTAAPISNNAYTLTFDFLQPANEASGYQAVIQHPRPEGNAYWWFEFGSDRFFLYTFGAGVWYNRWAAYGLTTDTWYRIRVRNTPTSAQITVSDRSGRELANSPLIVHDEGSPAPIHFAAVGAGDGSRGMKIDNVSVAVTPIDERPDYLERAASVEAATRAISSPEARNLWTEGDAQLADIRKSIANLRGLNPDDWKEYQRALAALDQSLSVLGNSYHDRVIARIPSSTNGWTMVDLSPYTNDNADKHGLRVKGDGPVVTLNGIPFLAVPFGRNVVFEDLPFVGDQSIPLNAETKKIALLLGALYERELYDHDDSLIDVLQVILHYTDGFEERFFPLRASDGQPVMSYGEVSAFTITPGHAGTIRDVTLHDQSFAAGWGLLGLSYQPGRAMELPVMRTSPTKSPHVVPREPTINITPTSVSIANAFYRIVVGKKPCLLTGISSSFTGGEVLKSPSPFFAMTLGQSLILSDQFEVATSNVRPVDGGKELSLGLRKRDRQPPLTVEIRFVVDQSPRLRSTISLRNDGKEPISPRLVFPLLDGLDLGPQPGWYFPQRGGAVSNKALEGLSSYGGMAWLQVVDLFNESGGLYLRSDDTAGVYKIMGLRNLVVGEQPRRIADIPAPVHVIIDPWQAKTGAHLSIQYLPPTLAPGETWSPPPATIAVHAGDYHAALNDYRDWLRTWWRNRPCPASYRYGFYALVGGTPEDNQRHPEFGSYDWWHLSPFWSIDYPDALKREIGELNAQGKRAAAWRQGVGVYIEGMVMEKSHRIAKEHGADWAMKDDEGNYYTYYSSPSDPTWSMCPAVKEWQDWDASARAEIAREVPLVAMYVDSIGSRWAEVCFNPAHHHTTPGIWPRGCGELFEAIRTAVSRISPMTAIHSEEPGCDYIAMHEDGSWSHSLWTALSGDRDYNPAGINYFRFVLPEFKMYEIPSYRHALWRCKLAFFNGEGLWTNVPDAARQKLFIQWMPTLREHADTFTGVDVEEDVPIGSPPLYVNRFSNGSKTIYTLYNSGTRTYRAAMEVNWPKGGHCFDLLNLRDINPSTIGTKATLNLTVHPHDVLCLMVAPRALTASVVGNALRVSIGKARPGEQIVVTPINSEGVRGEAVRVAAPAAGGTVEVSVKGWTGRACVRLAGEHDTRDEMAVDLRRNAEVR